MRLTARAPGKVNLCLYVGRPRPDGYHPLVSVVQPVSLADELTLEPHDGDEDVVVCPGVEGENLALRALRLYREATGWRAPPQRLTIVKRVPVAAGMGGGSSDAATALRLAAHADHRPGDPLLAELAAELGADVTSLLEPRRALMTGVGEQVEPLPGSFDRALVILPSDHALSTPAVYAEFDRLGLGRDEGELAELAERIRRDGAAELHNDLQAAALSLCPPVAGQLERLGAGALVSGSGPTVFALTDAPPEGAIAVTPVGPAFAAPRPA